MALENEPLTGKQKAAIICLVLGEDLSTEIFKRLDKDEVELISREISLMGAVPPDVADRVVEEFYNLTLAKKYIARGGIEYAKKVLIKSLGFEEAGKIIDGLIQLQEISPGFSSLEKINPRQLSKLIREEHPQIIALILAQLSAPRAAELISALPEEMRTEIIIRMANLEQISPGIIKKIIDVLERKLAAQASSSLEEYSGMKAASELLNHMDRRVSLQLLEQIESRAPEMAASIRDLMFVFEDILLIDDMGIMAILKRVDKKSLAIALKVANDELKSKFTANMSPQDAEILKDEIKCLGPIRVEEVEKAQYEIVEVVRNLEEEGIIVIDATGVDEYVV